LGRNDVFVKAAAAVMKVRKLGGYLLFKREGLGLEVLLAVLTNGLLANAAHEVGFGFSARSAFLGFTHSFPIFPF
jgi:hypothetical protein